MWSFIHFGDQGGEGVDWENAGAGPERFRNPGCSVWRGGCESYLLQYLEDVGIGVYQAWGCSDPQEVWPGDPVWLLQGRVQADSG